MLQKNTLVCTYWSMCGKYGEYGKSSHFFVCFFYKEFRNCNLRHCTMHRISREFEKKERNLLKLIFVPKHFDFELNLLL